MSLTTAQRAEQNRANAARSTGPRSESGKARSRTNALKHGLRAEALPMPGEDPALAAERSRAWNEFYRPQSPAAQHLVNACVRATLLSDRVDLHLTADAESRARQARADDDAADQERLDALLPRLGRQPDALAQLRSFAAGCRWMIEQWEGVEAALAAPGGVDLEPLDDALVLLDVAPSRELGMLALALDPRATRHPKSTDPATARARTDAIVASELAALRADAARLATAESSPASLLIPADDATARLHLRYQAEARTAFLRSWKALEAVLKSDALEGRGEEAGEQESPNEPEPVEAAPPNEPARVAEPAPKATVTSPVVAAPAARRERLVLDGGGRPANYVNMCIVPNR